MPAQKVALFLLPLIRWGSSDRNKHPQAMPVGNKKLNIKAPFREYGVDQAPVNNRKGALVWRRTKSSTYEVTV